MLIGMMGSGKSAVGAALARRLGRTLVDIDARIEAAAGCRIRGIFDAEGEAGFRERERSAIREAVHSRNPVIACGGGAVLDPDNVKVLKAHGTVVWLRVTPSVAAERIGSAEGRPILEAMAGDLTARIAALTEQRASTYEAAADLVIDADGPVETVAEAVLRHKL